MITQEFKQWVAIGAVFVLVGLFLSRMTERVLPDDPILLATVQSILEIETSVANNGEVPTATYTLAFVEAGAVALNPIATNAPALPAPTIAPMPTQVPIEPTQVVITQAPIEPTQVVITQAPVEPTQVAITQAPVEPTQVAITQAPVEPTQVAITQAPVEPTQVIITQAPVIPTETPRMVIPEDARVVIVATPNFNLPSMPASMNGLALESFVIMDDMTRENIRRIFTRGQMLGRNARSFTRIGDSTIEPPHFLTRFDVAGQYNLGDYGYLQGVIDYYAGSFGHDSIAIKRGMHTWSVFDPLWADNRLCAPTENVLVCEIRLANPSILLVRLGSNDAGVPNSTERNLRRLIEYCLEQGVIPVMGTKADRFEGGDINNQIIRRLASEYQIPLWDFDVAAGLVPGKGLGSDRVHLTSFFAHDWTSAEAWTRGHAVHNLSGLIMLDAVWQVLQGN